MDVLKLVEEWLLLYAVKRKYAQVLRGFNSRVDRPLLDWFPPCALESFVLYQIIHDRDVDNYDMGMLIVLGLYPAISDAVKASVIAKILDAMRVVALFELLKKTSVNQKVLVEEIDRYFPRSSPAFDGVESVTLKERMAKHCSEYRSLFLSLSANPEYCAMYMRKHYKDEFGNRFEARLTELVERLVTTVETRLPVSAVEKILHDNSQQSFSSKLRVFKFAAVELLLDHCENKEELTEDECLELLNKLRPPTGQTPLGELVCHITSSYYASHFDTEREADENLMSAGLTVLPEHVSSPELVSSSSEHVTSPGNSGVKRKILASPVTVLASSSAKKRVCLAEDMSQERQSEGHGHTSTQDSLDYPKGQLYRMQLRRVGSESGSSCHFMTQSSEEDGNKNCTGQSEELGKPAEQTEDRESMQGESNSKKEHSDPVSRSDPVIISSSGSSLDKEHVNTKSSSVINKTVPDRDQEIVIIVSDEDDEGNDIGCTPEQINIVSSTSEEGSDASKQGRLHKDQELTSSSSSSSDDWKDNSPHNTVIYSGSDVDEPVDDVIIPSSYSLDKFDAIVCDSANIVRATLPSIEKHLRPPVIKNCIVKLDRLEVDTFTAVNRVPVHL